MAQGTNRVRLSLTIAPLLVKTTPRIQLRGAIEITIKTLILKIQPLTHHPLLVQDFCHGKTQMKSLKP